MTNIASADTPTTTPALGLAAKVAAALGIPAAFPATWWLISLVDQSGDEIVDPDYFVRPPDLSSSTELVVGAVALVLCLAGIAAIAYMISTGRWHLSVAGFTLAPLAAFAFAGMTAQVLTAPTIGANIGAGLLLLLVPVVVVGTALAVIFAVASWRKQRPAV